MSTSPQTSEIATLVKQASAKQAAVHQRIASAPGPFTGTGSMTVKLILFGGKLTGSFVVDGTSYTFSGGFAGGGVAYGTSTGTLVCYVDPASLSGEVGMDGAMSGTGLAIGFTQNGVNVAQFQGSGVHGGGGITGHGTWSQGG